MMRYILMHVIIGLSIEAGFSPLIFIMHNDRGFSQNLIIINHLKLLTDWISYHNLT